MASACVVFLAIVGSYAMVKGQVSEKLSLRLGAAMGHTPIAVRKAPQWLPAGLDDRRWDFSPKEESQAPARAPLPGAIGRVFSRWAEGLGWVFVPMVGLGAWLARVSRQGRAARMLLIVYALLFTGALVRHVMTLGYLSGRHPLSLVIVALPWAAAGTLVLAGRIADRAGWDELRRRRAGGIALAAMVAIGVALQLKPAHESRWGHWAAGRWLARNARADEAILDTRGWAAFVADRAAYDAWHVRQALTDAKLTYLVIGDDELSARSRRADTWRAIVAQAASPAATFPARAGGREPGVWIYRFQQPVSWEGLRP